MDVSFRDERQRGGNVAPVFPSWLRVPRGGGKIPLAGRFGHGVGNSRVQTGARYPVAAARAKKAQRYVQVRLKFEMSGEPSVALWGRESSSGTFGHRNERASPGDLERESTSN